MIQIRLPFNHDYFLQLSKLLLSFYAFHLTNFYHYRKKEIGTCRSRKSSSILQPFKIDQCSTMKEWFITRLAKNTVKGQNRAHLGELCSSKTRRSPNGLRIPEASHESVLLFLFFASEMGWGMKVEAIFVPESPCPTEILQLLLKPAISWEKSSQKRRRKRKERYITRWSTKPPPETTDLLFFSRFNPSEQLSQRVDQWKSIEREKSGTKGREWRQDGALLTVGNDSSVSFQLGDEVRKVPLFHRVDSFEIEENWLNIVSWRIATNEIFLTRDEKDWKKEIWLKRKMFSFSCGKTE